ncbi:MAG: T9SS type A sorting domain-containing protein [Bacteroidota bacterium]
MKNFFFLLIALFLANGVLGQDSNPALQYTKFETPEIYPELTSRNLIRHQPNQQHALIQIYDSLYYWRWDTITIGWKNSYKAIDMVYDGSNNLISNIAQQFNNISWVNSYKYTNIYDASNNLINETGYLWTGTDWMNSNQNIYTYDGANNQTSFISKQWNTGWVNILKFTNTYDANNNQTSFLSQNWNNNAWVNSSLITWTYDAYNNWTSYLKQQWNGNAWENSWQFTSTYDVNHNLTIELQEKWTNGEWTNFAKYIHSYDTNNNDTCGLAQTWNGNGWENYHRDTYTYDAKGNNTSLTGQDWNGSTWIYSNQELFTYDANNFRSNYSNKNWNNAGVFIIAGDSTHYYYHTVSGTNDLISQGGGIPVFPNPTSEKITISAGNNGHISIFNLSGQQLLQQEITEPKTSVDVSGFKSGVYFVRVTDDKTVRVQKFVKD